MRRSGKGSGGGLGMNKVVRKPVKTGRPNKAINPGFAGQIGASIGDHGTGHRQDTGYRGEGMSFGSSIQSKLGNEVAYSTKEGAGGSRNVFACGSQHSLPAVKAPAKPNNAGKDILSEFEPDHVKRGRSG
jgi:hypothetical protein